MANIPASHQDLVQNPNALILATTMPDGTPQTTVLWFRWTGDTLQISTTAERQKTENIQSNPRVSAMIVDPNNMYRYLEVRGTVDITHNGHDDAYNLIDWLAKQYTGKNQYYGGVAPAENKYNETRVILNIKPEHVVARG
jgi:PPOX class probable F420-dependent enzyme